MSSILIWMLGIAISIAALVVTAAVKSYYLHMAIAALISILFALSAFGESRSIGATEAVPTGQLASTNLRHMGLVWAWGAITILVTYGFGILSWREWLHFFIALIVMAGLSLFMSATLKKDSDSGTDDQTMLKIARGYAIFVLAAMVITMIGLLVDGKLWRFTTAAGQRINSQDWAATNIFFFGALALGAVAWNAITVLRGATR